MHSGNESSPLIAVSLSPEGLITSLSPAAEQLTGYSAHELVGSPVAIVLGDQSADEIPQMLRSALDWGMWEGEIVHRKRGGSQSRGNASLVPLSAHQNGCHGFLLLLEARNRTLFNPAASPVTEVAIHLRRVFHELNNPLAVVMGFAQLILLDSHCEGKTRADLERIYSEMKRIVQIIEKLHTYALSLQEMTSESEPATVVH